MRIISLAKVYKKLPSEILGIDDEYTSFCFDEACAYITDRLQDKKRPQWEDEKKASAGKGNKELIKSLTFNNNKFLGTKGR